MLCFTYWVYFLAAFFLHGLIIHHINDEPLECCWSGFCSSKEHVNDYTQCIPVWNEYNFSLYTHNLRFWEVTEFTSQGYPGIFPLEALKFDYVQLSCLLNLFSIRSSTYLPLPRMTVRLFCPRLTYTFYQIFWTYLPVNLLISRSSSFSELRYKSMKSRMLSGSKVALEYRSNPKLLYI